MKPLIVANWKCNPVSLQEAKQLLNSIYRGLRGMENAEVVICPPFVYLADLRVSAFAKGYGGLTFGSQNCFWEEKGAFTGEISHLMLKNMGCQYVIIGHSERRKYFSEIDEMINKKLRAVLSAKLNPILCIGETLKERSQRKTKRILKNQLEKALYNLTTQLLNYLIIAYEPVWAIGTGKACLPADAKKTREFIQKFISQKFSQKIIKNISILYGGSVNSKNARSYITEAGFQGLLVGGASLDPKEFVKIVKSVSLG